MFWTQGIQGLQQPSTVESPHRFRSLLVYAMRKRSRLHFQNIHFSFTSVVIFLTFLERFESKQPRLERVYEFLKEFSIPSNDAQCCLLLIQAGYKRWTLCARLDPFQSDVDYSPLFRPEIFSLPRYERRNPCSSPVY